MTGSFLGNTRVLQIVRHSPGSAFSYAYLCRSASVESDARLLVAGESIAFLRTMNPGKLPKLRQVRDRNHPDA
jgi:hypothetical protein